MSKTETQSDALRLAETLEIYGHRGTQKAAAELRRLDARVKSLEFSFNEWHDKTDWVQDTAQALELGMHRADVLRSRIEALDAENKALRARLEIDPSHPIDGITAREETIRQLEAQLKALRERLEGAPVAGQCRFKGQTIWGLCSAEHVQMVLADPSYAADGYEVRYLYAAPQYAAKTGDAA